MRGVWRPWLAAGIGNRRCGAHLDAADLKSRSGVAQVCDLCAEGRSHLLRSRAPIVGVRDRLAERLDLRIDDADVSCDSQQVVLALVSYAGCGNMPAHNAWVTDIESLDKQNQAAHGGRSTATAML